MLFPTRILAKRLCYSAVTAMVFIFAGVDDVVGQNGQSLTRIEEDWAVAIVEPNSEITAPQFTAVMTPDHNDQSTYFTVEFNHSTSPEFMAGGIQLQTWTDNSQDDASPRLNNQTLSVNDERIRWTQYMEIKEQGLEFGLSSLNSSTWNSQSLENAKLTVFSTPLSNLNDYRISDSVNSSGVGYSANRVENMILVEVRAYAGDQLVQRIEVNQNLRNGNGGGSGNK